jgi:hypothetical protein
MTWTNQTKHSSSFTNETKHSSSFDNGVWYLLQEIGDYLLQESGGKIVLQKSWNFKTPITWTNQTKH